MGRSVRTDAATCATAYPASASSRRRSNNVAPLGYKESTRGPTERINDVKSLENMGRTRTGTVPHGLPWQESAYGLSASTTPPISITPVRSAGVALALKDLLLDLREPGTQSGCEGEHSVVNHPLPAKRKSS